MSFDTESRPISEIFSRVAKYSVPLLMRQENLKFAMKHTMLI